MSKTYDQEEGGAYNGHFGCTCYHPLFYFNQFGDVEEVMLRQGNVHSAEDWRSSLEPVVKREQDTREPLKNRMRRPKKTCGTADCRENHQEGHPRL